MHIHAHTEMIHITYRQNTRNTYTYEYLHFILTVASLLEHCHWQGSGSLPLTDSDFVLSLRLPVRLAQ